MTYARAIQFLEGLQRHGMRPGLETTLDLAQRVGNPHDKLRFIHVAGTNGKGSTCAMLESIYRASGLRMGLYTSPHLVHFTERIQVNRLPISESDLVREVEGLRSLLGEARGNEILTPTLFEFTTVIALQYFLRERCDLVVWETGLGGRLDSTNIVTPIASVITQIDRDHEVLLGDTIQAIANEKAGIIKPGIPVFTSSTAPDALQVIRERARELHAPLTEITSRDADAFPWDSPLAGRHQRENAALALAVVRGLRKVLPVDESAIESGFTKVNWAGRFELVQRAHQQWILDGAHNPSGIQALVSALKERFPGRRFAFVLGILSDKNWKEMCEHIAPLALRIVAVPVASERTVAPEHLAAQLRDRWEDIPVETASVSSAYAQLEGEPIVVATGSLYLVGELSRLLGVARGSTTNEQRLNEYTWDQASIGTPTNPPSPPAPGPPPIPRA